MLRREHDTTLQYRDIPPSEPHSRYLAMSTDYQIPQFNLDEIKILLKDLYRLEGKIKFLDGERDLNCLVDTEKNRWVFKIANKLENPAMLECQHQVFQLIAQQTVFRQTICAQPSINKKEIEMIYSSTGTEHHCRLLPFIDGQLLSDVKPRSQALYHDLGRSLGQLDVSLAGFSHPGIERPLLWDISEADDRIKKFKPLIKNPHRHSLIDHFHRRYLSRVLPEHAQLRNSVIHNDANDNNVIVDPNNSNQISCLIDFGDMLKTWLVAEPAIAIAYALLDEDDPIDCSSEIARGYHSAFPLTEFEQSILFDLVTIRLCTSVCICAYQKSLQPDNKYLAISEKPAWQLLERLIELPSSRLISTIQDTCR
jgi:Ser/Thr protein kinase RdoA (MazF antagonist)